MGSYVRDETCSGEAMRNMFVGDIALGATSDELKAFFEEKVGHGNVVSATVLPPKDPSQKISFKNRDKPQKFLMGFALFTDCDILEDLFLMRDELIFKGKKLDIRRAVSKEDQSPGARDRKCVKLFLANIPKDEGIQGEIEQYFADRHDPKYGEITDINLIKDKQTGSLKGFGFVTVSSPDMADRMAMQHKTMVLKGRKIDVKKKSDQQDNSYGGGFGGGYGGGYDQGYGGQGGQRGRGRGAPRGASRGAPARGGRGAPRGGRGGPPKQSYGGGYGDGGYGGAASGGYEGDWGAGGNNGGYDQYQSGAGGYDQYDQSGYQAEYDQGYDQGYDQSYGGGQGEYYGGNGGYSAPARGRGGRGRAGGYAAY